MKVDAKTKKVFLNEILLRAKLLNMVCDYKKKDNSEKGFSKVSNFLEDELIEKLLNDPTIISFELTIIL